MPELRLGSAYDIKVRDDRTPTGYVEYVGVIYNGLDAATDEESRTVVHLFGFDPSDPYPPFAVPSDSLLSYEPNTGNLPRVTGAEDNS